MGARPGIHRRRRLRLPLELGQAWGLSRRVCCHPSRDALFSCALFNRIPPRSRPRRWRVGRGRLFRGDAWLSGRSTSVGHRGRRGPGDLEDNRRQQDPGREEQDRYGKRPEEAPGGSERESAGQRGSPARFRAPLAAKVAASRAVREHSLKGRGAGRRVPPVLGALWTVMEVRPASCSGRRIRLGLREAPGAPGDEPAQTPALVGPVTLADRAVVGVGAPDQQVLTAGAEGTVLGADMRKIAGVRFECWNLANQGCRSRVLPMVALGALMRVSPVRIVPQRGQRRFSRPLQEREQAHLCVTASSRR
jgi:hypothetical protein